MPPKNSPSNNNTTKPSGPTKEQLKAINQYLAHKPDFDKLIAEAKANSHSSTEPYRSEYDKILRAAVKETLDERRAEATAWSANMPVNAKEEETKEHIYDQVAKESKDSGASTHQLHQDPHKVAVQAHGANPGPVIAENLGQPASKEELRKRAEELNKK